MRKAFIFIALLLKHTVAKLSLSDINDVVDQLSLEVRNKNLIHSSIINPVFGYLFESMGALSNIRFFGPKIQINKESGTRNYLLDSSTEPFVQTIIDLFPSENGVLCHISNDPENLGMKLKTNKVECMKHLTDMFINALTLQANMVNNLEVINAYNNAIQLMAIHAFLINALDDKSDLELFLSGILFQSDDIPINTYEMSTSILKTLMKMKEKFNDFPYSEFEQPQLNDAIPFYDREAQHFLSNDMVFLDYNETLLFNICNCLFYDPESKCYSIENLDQSSELAKFYKKNKYPQVITAKVRKQWSIVVQGLDDFTSKDESKYKLNSILYSNEKRNGLSGGIINMMNALVRICNIDHSKFWSNFNGKNIEEKLEELFFLMSPNFQKYSMTVDAKPESFVEFESNERVDFTGNYKLIFQLPIKKKVELIIKHKTTYGSIRVENYHGKFSGNDIFTFNVESQFADFPLIVLKNYFEIIQGRNYLIGQSSSFNKLYLSGPIETDEQKKDALIVIGEAPVESLISKFNHELKEKVQTATKIFHSILDSMDLTNTKTKELLMPVLYFYDDLKQDEIINCWLRSFTIESVNIYKLWEKRILDLNLRSFSVSFYKIPIMKIESIFEVLSKCNALKSFNAQGINPVNEHFVLEGISKLPNLEALDLSNNKFSYEGLKGISETLPKLENLTTLNLAKNYIDFKDIKYIAKGIKNLKNLACLKLSKNHIGSKGSKYISKAIKCLKHLSVLELSENHLGSKGIEYIANAIKNLKKISKLDISDNYINPDGSKHISKILKELENLESLNLSGNCIGCKGIKYISKAFCDLKNLTDLDLTANCIGSEGAEYISETIGQLTKLYNLNLSYNYLETTTALNNIADSLKGLSDLTILNLSHNSIDTKSFEEILEILKENSKLSIINSPIDDQSEETSSKMQQSLRDLNNLTSHDLLSSNLKYWEMQHIMQALQN